jgi:probable F420-dependent oxidoreductase
MSRERPFKFGIQASTASSASDWADLARRVEDLGFTNLYLPDHFGDQLAPMPAMMAAADATTDLRVGALVLDNDYKHPVVLAKEIATLDVLSGGRVDFGIGAGWMTTDYEQSGIPLDPPKIRVDPMEEGIAVYKGLFSGEPFSYQGEHYEIAGLAGTPKPIQQPHPPLLIGGGGRRVLSIAAREADIVGINPNMKSGVVGPDAAADATAEATDRKVGWVRAAAGDRFDDIDLSMLVFAAITTDDRAGTAEMMAGVFGITPEEMADVPHAWIGSVDEICEAIRAQRERWGISHFVLPFDTIETTAPVVAALAGT